MNASGTGQTNLTNAPGADVNPGWSPDGTRLAFDSDPLRQQRRLHDECERHGADEPHRDQPAARRRPGLVTGRHEDPLRQRTRCENRSVWRMNTDGGGAVDATQASIYDADPNLVTRGAHIVFSQDAGGPDLQPLDGTRRRNGEAPGDRRPGDAAELVPRLGRPAATSTVDVTSFEATPVNPKAGIAQVDLDDVPASVLLAPSRTTESAPLGETPLGETARRNPARRNAARRNPARRDEPRPRRPHRGPADGAPVVAAAPPRGRLAGGARAHLARQPRAPERQPRRRVCADAATGGARRARERRHHPGRPRLLAELPRRRGRDRVRARQRRHARRSVGRLHERRPRSRVAELVHDHEHPARRQASSRSA